MPYKIRKRDGKWCVVKKSDPDGDSLGCHDDQDGAKTQLAALYASEPTARMSREAVIMAKVERSHDDIRTMLQMKLTDSYGMNADGRPNKDCWIRDVFPSYFVYSEGYGPAAMYKRDYSIDADGQVTLGTPVPVKPKTTYEAVKMGTFSMATFGATSGWVVKEGKLFEAGFFPDKQFEMQPPELEAAVARYKASGATAQVDIEHMPTILDGKLGHVQDVWVDEDGISLFGKVAIPEWLDQTLNGDELKVSATWDRESKDLVGLALVLNPRISDAALMAAFSHQGQASQPANQSTQPKQAGKTGGVLMGALDTVSAFLDAVLKGGDVTREDLLAAVANAGNGGAPATGIGAQGQPTGAATTGGQPTGTAGTFGQVAQGQPVPSSAQQPNGVASIGQVVQYAEQASVQAQANAALQAQMATLQRNYIEQMAVAFADNLIMVKKVSMPNERDAIIAAYRTAAWDDYNHPSKVTFGQNVEGTRVDALAFLYATRTPHGFDQEFVGDGQATSQNGVLFNATTNKQVDAKKNDAAGADAPVGADTIAKLLAMTPLGNATLESKSKAA